jgi:pyruvate dehydrogenase E1 component alpha subunit
MAALWSLPVLYIIENNEYAMGTSVARSTFETDLYKRGLSLGIHGLKVDGMDFDKVYEVIKKASDEIRSSSFPQIIEVKTYRYKGHSMSDPAKYRTKEEVDGYKMHDPIELLRSKLIQQNHIDEDQIKEIEKRVKSVVQEAVDFAQISSEPNENELYTDIYI